MTSEHVSPPRAIPDSTISRKFGGAWWTVGAALRVYNPAVPARRWLLDAWLTSGRCTKRLFWNVLDVLTESEAPVLSTSPLKNTPVWTLPVYRNKVGLPRVSNWYARIGLGGILWKPGGFISFTRKPLIVFFLFESSEDVPKLCKSRTRGQPAIHRQRLRVPVRVQPRVAGQHQHLHHTPGTGRCASIWPDLIRHR